MCADKSRESPLFSIVLPTRNRAALLGRAVASVLRQSLGDFELIIVDDGSTEPCDIGLFADRRIILIRNRKSLGVAQARNIGIAASRGRYISFLDDDDEYLDSFLSSTHACLKDTPEEVGVSWCGVKLVDYPYGVDGTVTVRERIKDEPLPKDRRGVIERFASIATSYGFTGKSECLQKVGPFDRRLKVGSDTEYFLRILEKGFVPVKVPGVHIVRYMHGQGRLTEPEWFPERIRTSKRLLSRYSAFMDQYPGVRKNLLVYLEFLKRSERALRDRRQTSRFRRLQRKLLPRFLLP